MQEWLPSDYADTSDHFSVFTSLILEPSIQPQFLIPFAASLGIGIMITTGLLMLLMPALMAVFLQVNSSRAE